MWNYRVVRKKAYSRVNFIMVEAYWKIGQRIVEEEQGGATKAVYGEGLLKSLSRELTTEFGRGFSYANLRNFRQFYLTYPDFEKCYTLCSKLSWSHNRLIMRSDHEHESDLEKGLLGKLRNFLLELGKGFSFVDRQFRIRRTKNYY